MGEADGRIIGLTKIYDSGPPSDRWNLVLVAEGYQGSELPKFYDDAQMLVDHLLDTPPFDEEEVVCAMNVYRLDVISDESGADDPSAGISVDTYFDVSFGTGDLFGDELRVWVDVADYLPEYHHIIVLVNTTTHGGKAFATVGWSYTGGGPLNWPNIAVHELGHLFGLADEYDDSGNTVNHFLGNEPIEPNVTAEPDPALVKWSHLVTAGPEVPTRENPNCADVSPGTTKTTAPWGRSRAPTRPLWRVPTATEVQDAVFFGRRLCSLSRGDPRVLRPVRTPGGERRRHARHPIGQLQRRPGGYDRPAVGDVLGGLVRACSLHAQECDTGAVRTRERPGASRVSVGDATVEGVPPVPVHRGGTGDEPRGPGDALL
jgi:hypothetical protein